MGRNNIRKSPMLRAKMVATRTLAGLLERRTKDENKDGRDERVSRLPSAGRWYPLFSMIVRAKTTTTSTDLLAMCRTREVKLLAGSGELPDEVASQAATRSRSVLRHPPWDEPGDLVLEHRDFLDTHPTRPSVRHCRRSAAHQRQSFGRRLEGGGPGPPRWPQMVGRQTLRTSIGSFDSYDDDPDLRSVLLRARQRDDRTRSYGVVPRFVGMDSEA